MSFYNIILKTLVIVFIGLSINLFASRESEKLNKAIQYFESKQIEKGNKILKKILAPFNTIDVSSKCIVKGLESEDIVSLKLSCFPEKVIFIIQKSKETYSLQNGKGVGYSFKITEKGYSHEDDKIQIYVRLIDRELTRNKFPTNYDDWVLRD